MPLSSDGKEVTLGESVSFIDFPELVNAHLDWCRDTPSCEALGAELNASLLAGNATQDQVWRFIAAVCKWGGRTGNRVRGIVAKSYDGAVTLEKFTAAARALAGQDPATTIQTLRVGLESAAQSIDDVVGLATSYATKMVRFMRPDVAGVLDSVISRVGGYPCNNFSFAAYSIDCLAVASDLAEAGILNPRTGCTLWRVGDVDQALFARCQGWAETSTGAIPLNRSSLY